MRHIHFAEDRAYRCGFCGRDIEPGTRETVDTRVALTDDNESRQRAEEALIEGFSLNGDDAGCQCPDCKEIAEKMVDTVIEAWRGR